MGDKRQMLFPSPLQFKRALRRIGFQCQSDRMVKHPIQNVKGLALKGQSMFVGQVVNAATQNVVFRDDLFNIIRILHTLQTV